MRSEKFDTTKSNWDSDDIGYALEYNPQKNLSKSDIDVIVAEVTGENDGAHWYWIIQRKDGKFQYITGGCDYTGWDCQSHADASELFETAEEALAQAPEKEEYYARYPRIALKLQLEDKMPFGLYDTGLIIKTLEDAKT